MGKVVKGSQRELSVCEGVSEGVRMSVNFKFIELLTQLKNYHENNRVKESTFATFCTHLCLFLL